MSNDRKKSRRGKTFKKKSNLELPSFDDEKNLHIFKNLETKAHEAINQQKVFTIVGGFDIIRTELIRKGWIEQIADLRDKKLTEKIISETSSCYEKTRHVLSYLVQNSPLYFVWAPKYYEISSNIVFPLRNRINRMRTSDFTLKEGLHNLAENIQFFTWDNISELIYPRSYLLMNLYQRDFFLTEFRRTLISSFLFFLNDCKNFDEQFSEDGAISIDLVYNSIERIEHLIKVKKNLGIDLQKTVDFSKQIDEVVNQGRKIRFPEYVSNFSLEKLKTQIKVAVAEIHFYWPETKYDSIHNIWILKPINKSRGFGVVLMNNVEKIFDHVLRHNENKYIIQKYIERPFLIHQAKFDIRQYFLTVISRDEIKIWIYRNSYLKFSSQEFSLKILHESVHLTNHAVQRFYKNSVNRDDRLPKENMWNLMNFIEYLRLQKRENIWEEIIFPKIKKNLLAVILASLEDTDLHENSFELNGADFLIGFDMEPILLEINANPDLTYTTSVTRDLCPQVMKDVIKVVIDYKNDFSASTGDFELSYVVPISRTFPVQKIQLGIDGKKILPPPKIKSKKFFKMKNFSDLSVHGEKLFKVSKSTRIPMETKIIAKKEETISRKKVFPLKIYKSPRKSFRNILQTKMVKPPNFSNDITSKYIKNCKFLNLSDLVSFLSLKD